MRAVGSIMMNGDYKDEKGFGRYGIVLKFAALCFKCLNIYCPNLQGLVPDGFLDTASFCH